MNRSKVAVIVAGSWGTALASVFANNGYDVKLWSRNREQVSEINTHHTNSKYLPGQNLPHQITATHSIEEAVTEAVCVLLVAPSTAMRDISKQIKPWLKSDTLLMHATKGFESDTLKTMSEVIIEELPHIDPSHLAVLSGPSHAEEVIRECPTTVVVASNSKQHAELAQDMLINHYFRVYTNPDVLGVEISGALKNIIALGAGLSDGLGYGDNAKAALLTRGLTEITRLGSEMGASPLTFAGLAGVGDLVVTCTSKHSRNWRAGYMLGQGKSLDEVLSSMGMVVEGIKTTRAAYALSQTYQVEMPITEQLYKVLFEQKPPKQAVEDLMGRGRTHEIEDVIRNRPFKFSS